MDAGYDDVTKTRLPDFWPGWDWVGVARRKKTLGREGMGSV